MPCSRTHVKITRSFACYSPDILQHECTGSGTELYCTWVRSMHGAGMKAALSYPGQHPVE